MKKNHCFMNKELKQASGVNERRVKTVNEAKLK